MDKMSKIKEIVNDTAEQYYFDDGKYLIDMMFAHEPIEKFQKLWDVENDIEAWKELLHMAHYDIRYTQSGGDEGYLKKPFIDYDYIEYLEKLIAFLK